MASITYKEWEKLGDSEILVSYEFADYQDFLHFLDMKSKLNQKIYEDSQDFLKQIDVALKGPTKH